MTMRVRTGRGKIFDAHMWDGVRENLPEWLQDQTIEVHSHHGPLLHVGAYLVRTNRWVLRGDERGDIFPCPQEMFEDIYTEITDEDGE